jgi:thiol-disulfide isomerase/thioredoxin
MRSVMRTAALILLGMVAPSLRAGEAWHIEFEEGRSAAKAQDKDLLIDFGGSDWCLPCRWLKERVLSKPEFIARAGGDFVLVDIDLPYRSPIPADRKQRYQELQRRYGINSFPTVVLALPDGRPYARTTYREASQTPDAYWRHLEPLHERGGRLKVGLARAATLEGRDRAEALAEGLGQVNPRFILGFFADRVADLRKVDPTDATGYLAFLDGRRALDELQAGMDLFKAAIDPAAVDALIARNKLRGEALQEALVLRAAGEILAGQDRRALHTLTAVVDAQATRSRFDRGDFILLDAESIATVRRRIAEGETDTGDGVALYYALHRILEFDLPNSYEESCGEAFRPNIRVRETIGDRYGRALIRSTDKLQGEARARALAKGLDGTFFAARGAIREIVLELIPRLVSKDEARKILPGNFYPRWIN